MGSALEALDEVRAGRRCMADETENLSLPLHPVSQRSDLVLAPLVHLLSRHSAVVDSSLLRDYRGPSTSKDELENKPDSASDHEDESDGSERNLLNSIRDREVKNGANGRENDRAADSCSSHGIRLSLCQHACFVFTSPYSSAPKGATRHNSKVSLAQRTVGRFGARGRRVGDVVDVMLVGARPPVIRAG